MQPLKETSPVFTRPLIGASNPEHTQTSVCGLPRQGSKMEHARQKHAYKPWT